MNSVVTQQIGQCGNQVGCEFFDILADAALNAKGTIDEQLLSRYFRSSRSESEQKQNEGKAIARACLIDMEPKVIRDAQIRSHKSNTWLYNPGSTFSRQSGSANNWAWGYAVHAPTIRNNQYNIVRKEVEQCDNQSSFLILQSLAGGTGSGVGTYMTEAQKDWYPRIPLLNQTIWPYEQGEVVVQNLNSLLSLSNVMNSSDGVIQTQNDTLHAIATHKYGLKQPDFHSMNRIVARHLISALAPSQEAYSGTYTKYTDPRVPMYKTSTNSMKSNILHMDSIYEHVFSSRYKQSTIAMIPETTAHNKSYESNTWTYISKHAQQQFQTPSQILLQTKKPGELQKSLINWNLTTAHHIYMSDPFTKIEGDLQKPSNMVKLRQIIERPIHTRYQEPDVHEANILGKQPSYPTEETKQSENTCRAYSLYVHCRGRDATQAAAQWQSDPLLQDPTVNTSWSAAQEQGSKVLSERDKDAPVHYGQLQPQIYSTQNPQPLLVGYNEKELFNDEKQAVIWGCSQKIVPVLDRMVGKAWSMFTSSAYIHHYERCGMEDDDFQAAFATMETVLQDYKA